MPTLSQYKILNLLFTKKARILNVQEAYHVHNTPSAQSESGEKVIEVVPTLATPDNRDRSHDEGSSSHCPTQRENRQSDVLHSVDCSEWSTLPYDATNSLSDAAEALPVRENIRASREEHDNFRSSGFQRQNRQRSKSASSVRLSGSRVSQEGVHQGDTPGDSEQRQVISTRVESLLLDNSSHGNLDADVDLSVDEDDKNEAIIDGKTSANRGSILKRGESFIKRPESRAKSVTFSRSSSVANFAVGDLPKTPRERTGSIVDNEALAIFNSKNAISLTARSEPTANGDVVLRPEYSHQQGIVHQPTAPRQRPYSSGSGFRRVAATLGTFQRKGSFHLDRRNTDNIGNGFVPHPWSKSFLLQRDSFSVKPLISGISARPFQQPPQPLQQGDTTDGIESPPFETYIIKNGRLIRRNSRSRRSDLGDLCESQVLSKGPSSSLATTVESEASEDPEDKGNHSRQRSSREEIMRSSSKISSGMTNDDLPVEPDEHSRSEEGNGSRRGSRSGCPTPASDLAGPSIVDSKGGRSRWSRIRQAIVSETVDSQTDISTSSLLNQRTSTVMSANIPENLKPELDKLGFRTRKETRKGRPKSKAGQRNSIQEQTPSTMIINLKTDPLLQKVCKRNRNVGKFRSKPQARPHAVCFETFGIGITHKDIMSELVKLTDSSPDIKIDSIQFHYRSLINNKKDMYNRWIITTNSMAGRNRLAGSTIVVNDTVFQLRRYDDIINSEYQQFVRMNNFVKMMDSRKILS